MPKRERVSVEDVRGKVEPLLFVEFRKQGNEFLDSSLWMYGNGVRRIHLQRVLYAVRMHDNAEDGSVFLVRLLDSERRCDVVEFARN